MKLSTSFARALIFLIASVELCCTSTNRRDNYRFEKGTLLKNIDDFDLKADIYIPQTAGLKPAVIVVHGGGWEHRSGEMHNVSENLAEAGFVVLNTTYRLSPQNTYPKAVDDVREALRWLKANAEKYEVDPNKISGWGYSAGAHLVLLAGIDGKAGFKSIVAGGTPADLTVWPDSKLVRQFLGAEIKDKPELWKEASPINHLTDQTPPIFLYHGEWDHLVEYSQMTRLEKALREKNRHVETYTESYMGHIAVYLFSQRSVDLGVDFLKRMQ